MKRDMREGQGPGLGGRMGAPAPLSQLEQVIYWSGKRWHLSPKHGDRTLCGLGGELYRYDSVFDSHMTPCRTCERLAAGLNQGTDV